MRKLSLHEQLRLLTVDRDYYAQNCERAEREILLLKQEIDSLKDIIRVYQGMSSLPIACERITDALAHVITDFRIANRERR